MTIDFGLFISDTNQCKNIPEAFSLLEKYLSKLGLDRVVYSLITDHPTLKQKSGHAIFGNYPECWMKHYFAKDYFHIDPTIKIIKQRSGPFSWKDTDKIKQGLERNESLLMEEAREAKLLNGIGLSFHDNYGEIVGMGVASSTGGVNLDKNTMCMVNALCSQFHIFYREKERKFTPPLISLSKREREVLTLFADGKTGPEISEILCISEETVKTYKSRLYVKLDVNSIQLAVVKATYAKLVHPSTPQDFFELAI